MRPTPKFWEIVEGIITGLTIAGGCVGLGLCVYLLGT